MMIKDKYHILFALRFDNIHVCDISTTLIGLIKSIFSSKRFKITEINIT